MPSLTRVRRFSFLLTAGVVFCFTVNARAQSPDPKAKATASISGRVTIDGKAAPGVPIAAFSAESPNRRVAVARTATDNDGNYRLSGLTASQYQVVSLTPNLVTAERGSEQPYSLVYVGSSKNIVLAASEEVGDIDLKLVRGGVITGRVTDADNKPAIEQHVSIQLFDENGNPSRTGLAPISNGQMFQTDDRGIYRIYGLPAGHYKVSVGNEPGGGLASNGRGYYQRTFYPDATDTVKAKMVEVSEGSEATGIDIQLGHRAETFSAAGRVVDADTGQPIPGARVAFLIAPQDSSRYSPFFSGQPAGARGEFGIDGLSPGRYAVYVAPQYDGGNSYSDPVHFEIIDSDVSGLEVKAVRGLSISGSVIVDSGAPNDLLAQLKQLRISAYGSNSSSPQFNNGGSSLVGPDGSFQINGLRPGRVTLGLGAAAARRPSIVRIEHEGVVLTQGFELQTGQSISGVRVVITYGAGTIRGTVRFEGGTPPPGMRTFVRCNREGTREGAGAQLDSRGHFVINGLTPGSYDVYLQVMLPTGRPGSERPLPPQKQSVSVANDSEAQVEFVIDLAPKGGGP